MLLRYQTKYDDKFQIAGGRDGAFGGQSYARSGGSRYSPYDDYYDMVPRYVFIVG